MDSNETPATGSPEPAADPISETPKIIPDVTVLPESCDKILEDGSVQNVEPAAVEPIPCTVNHTTEPEVPKELVDFKVIYNKQKFDVSFPIDLTVATLKQHIQVLTGVPPAMQKVMFKGLAKEEKTLRELGVTKGTKLMVVGSTLSDVLSVNAPAKQESKDEKGATAGVAAKEPLSQQKVHRKVLDKGVPEDAMVGIKNERESLPSQPLSGMLNKGGGKVRLTFKLESDQLWIGTKERTEKIPMNSIKNVNSEPIVGHEEYHMLGIQLGPTEASQYWVYWVPAQFVDAIKDAILGKWQIF